MIWQSCEKISKYAHPEVPQTIIYLKETISHVHEDFVLQGSITMKNWKQPQNQNELVKKNTNTTLIKIIEETKKWSLNIYPLKGTRPKGFSSLGSFTETSEIVCSFYI